MWCLAAHNEQEQHKKETKDEEIERNEPQPPKQSKKKTRIAAKIQSSLEVNEEKEATKLPSKSLT